MSNKYYVGDLGTEVILDCGEDVSAAVGPRIYVQKPDGTRTSWNATAISIASVPNYIRYFTVAGDFDQAGEYLFQAGITFAGGWSGRGETTIPTTVYQPFE